MEGFQAEQPSSLLIICLENRTDRFLTGRKGEGLKYGSQDICGN